MAVLSRVAAAVFVLIPVVNADIVQAPPGVMTLLCRRPSDFNVTRSSVVRGGQKNVKYVCVR